MEKVMESRRTFLLGMLAAGVPVRSAGAQGFGGGFEDAFGPRFGARLNLRDLRLRRRRRGAGALERLRHWNEIAIDASGFDHTPVAPGERRVFGEQLGPCRSSRAMAIVHTAVFDAVNAIVGGYQGYTGLRPAPVGTSLEAAIAQAAHDTLAALFPSQRDDFEGLLGEDLREIREGPGKANGIKLGRAAAAAMLARRQHDGADHPEPRIGVDWRPGDGPGQWRQDPISQHPLAMGAHWGEVEPFVLQSGQQLRVPPPPPLTSRQYAAAFQEVQVRGGDGVVTPTVRTSDQTFVGTFWAYDGTPSLCAPPRLYNQIATRIAEQRGTDTLELARLLALVNVAMADAGIAIWESKYHYRFWRPVTGIREADGNGATPRDRTFSPLGAPASNLAGPNFTPPFPAYPSGHAGFGGALFQMLRNVYGTDQIPFTFVSDEFNGETLDNEGRPRPLVPRRFGSLSQAEEENGQSRIYLGLHWAFDKTAGIAQGRHVADYVYRRAFVRLRH
jgi:hypothetical protein